MCIRDRCAGDRELAEGAGSGDDVEVEARADDELDAGFNGGCGLIAGGDSSGAEQELRSVLFLEFFQHIQCASCRKTTGVFRSEYVIIVYDASYVLFSGSGNLRKNHLRVPVVKLDIAAEIRYSMTSKQMRRNHGR